MTTETKSQPYDIEPAPPPPLQLPPSPSSSSLDDSYETYKQSLTQPITTTSSETRLVLRKIDRRVVPILFLTYLLQYLDKNGINYASVYGLQEGTHLHGQDYSWLGSIFYFGYFVAQYPAGYALQRLPIAKFLGVATLGL